MKAVQIYVDFRRDVGHWVTKIKRFLFGIVAVGGYRYGKTGFIKRGYRQDVIAVSGDLNPAVSSDNDYIFLCGREDVYQPAI